MGQWVEVDDGRGGKIARYLGTPAPQSSVEKKSPTPVAKKIRDPILPNKNPPVGGGSGGSDEADYDPHKVGISPWIGMEHGMGDIKQKDYTEVSKMDPDQPNIYYGTENEDGSGRYNESLAEHTRRVVDADTPEDVIRRKGLLDSVVNKDRKKGIFFPFTRFSPKLGPGDLQGLHIPAKGGAYNDTIKVQANGSPLNTTQTIAHEFRHARGTIFGSLHASENDADIMSSPPNQRMRSTAIVQKKLMEQGLSEEEAAATIANDLMNDNTARPSEVRNVLGYKFEGSSRHDPETQWAKYEKTAPDRLKKLREYRLKNRDKKALIDVYGRTTNGFLDK